MTKLSRNSRSTSKDALFSFFFNKNRISLTETSSVGFGTCHQFALAEILLSDLTKTRGGVDYLHKVVFESETNLRELSGRFPDTEAVDLNVTMCGFLLPKQLKWPFLSTSMKQQSAFAPHLLFCRLSGTHPALHQETLRLVNEYNKDVVVVGASVPYM